MKRGDKESFVNGVPRFGGQTGGKAALWKDDEMSFVIAEKSCAFIEKSKDKPFFLFMSTHNIHVPRAPNPKFKGKSDCGVHGDAIVEFDWVVGQVLDKLGLAENTLVVLTSDNGGVNDDNGPDKVHGIGDPDATNGHKPNGALRGTKGTVYEGGTRVPCLVAWPGKVKAGTSDALFSSVDWFPTLLAMTGVEPKTVPKVDGVDQAPALLGQKPVRDTVYVHFPHGSETQEVGIPGFWPATWVRRGDWKLIRSYAKNDNGTDRLELYNLKDDVGETKNLTAEKPTVVKELAGLIDAFLKYTEAVVPKANPGFGKQPAAGGAAGWAPSEDAAVATKDGGLVITSTGGDPFVVNRDVPAGAGPYTVEFKMKSGSRGTGQVFWTTADTGFHRHRSATVEPKHDGEWHEYALKLPVEKALTAFRLDPSTAPGEIRLNAI